MKIIGGKWQLSSLLLLVAVLSLAPLVDQRASADCERLFKRTLVTFALARTLNGVISVVQGTEIALQPAGVGVTLTPGEILDPVNDLVERFSWIMLSASISLGIQNVALEFSAWWPVQALTAVLAAWLALQPWLRKPPPGALVSMGKRLFVVLLFLRFAAPVMLIANDFLYQQFLEPRYRQSTETITAAGQELEQLGTDTAGVGPRGGDGGVLDALGRAWSQTVDSVDLSGKLERMKARAGELTEHLVQLSVVFVLQAVVLPLAFLWVFLEVAKRLFGPLRSGGRGARP